MKLKLGGIVSGFGGGYTFKVNGDLETVRRIKKELQRKYNVTISERCYHDE